jgi:hypothetical protein
VQAAVPITRREIAGHDLVEVKLTERYRPYDRLVLRDPKARTFWTVLSCEQADEGWNITAIRCLSGCMMHRRKR